MNGVAVFAERAQLRDDPIAVATERLVFGFPDANILGGRSPQGLTDCRQLGTLPMVLRPLVVTFGLEQLILAPKPLELGTDGVSFHPDPNAVFLESAEIGENPIEHPTDRLAFTLGDSPCGLAGLQIGMRVFELPAKLVQEIQQHTSIGTDRVHHHDGGRGFVVTRGRRKIRREGLELVIAVLAADVAAAPGILDPQADLAVGADRDKLRRRLDHGFSSPQRASLGS